MRNCFSGTLIVTLLLAACVPAKAQLSLGAFTPAGHRARATLRALNALSDARTDAVRNNAIQALPFGTAESSNADVRMNTEQPWIPFDTMQSELHGHDELIPAALRVLYNRLAFPAHDDYSRQLNNQDVVTAATVIATVGGQKAVHSALPILLRTIASRKDQGDFVCLWQLSNCLVTLCGADKVAADVAAVLSDPSPEIRATAATVIGMRRSLIGNNNVERGGDGKYRQLLPQAALNKTFLDALPTLVHIVAIDSDASVRLAALHGLNDAMYGAKEAPWHQALPDLAEALKRSGTGIEEKKALLRSIAELPYDPFPLFPAFRSFITADDPFVKTYAVIALWHACLLHREQIAHIYLSDIVVSDVRQQKRALAEMEIAVSTIWGYGDPIAVPSTNIYTYDTSILAATFAIRPEGERPFPLTRRGESQNPLRRHIIDVLVSQGLKSPHAEIRLATARTLETVGKVVQSSQGHGGEWQSTQPDVAPTRSALIAASDAVRTDDPNLSARLVQLTKHLVPIVVF